MLEIENIVTEIKNNWPLWLTAKVFSPPAILT